MKHIITIPILSGKYKRFSFFCILCLQSSFKLKLLSIIKDGVIRYCATTTSRNGVNKNSTCLLSSLDQLGVRTATSVQTNNFSTLYTSIPHKLLKSRIASLVHNSFKKKDESTCYTHIKDGKWKGYFINSINGGGEKCIQQIRYAI